MYDKFGVNQKITLSTFLCYRRVRIVGRGAYRVAAGKIAVRPGGILPNAVPEPTDEVWQTFAAIALASNSLVAGDRAAVLREARG